MKDPKFTLHYMEGEELPLTPLKRDHKSIQDAIDYCNTNNIPLDIVLITEWNNDELDGYGVPDIIATVCLGNVVLDGETEELTRYSIY